MAKTYHQVNPDASIIIILDKADTVGGVWAHERLYNFNTNNMLGSFEFSDFPMTEDQAGIKPGQHIPSGKVHEYLRLYAEHYGLVPMFRFRCNVESAELLEGGLWLLTVQKTEPSQLKAALLQMTAKCLVVATGILSHPFMPALKGSETFKGILFHTQGLGSHAPALKNKSVVIFGASKSAWDACYLTATQGCAVHWIIPASGNGPRGLCLPP